MSGFDPLAPRPDVVAAALAWRATPYRHQQSLQGVGCDCLGLVRGVWRELYGPEPETPPPYRPDWAEAGDDERLLAAARRWLVEIAPAAAAPGAVLLFRMSPDACVKHCAILTHNPTADPPPAEPHGRMVHAYWGRAVVESWIGPWWRRRLVAAFAFPPLPPASGG